jgi:undecaprenyl diphosphate synthase
MDWLVRLLHGAGVKEISIYLSSIQNFRRNREEMAASLELVASSLTREIPELAGALGLRVVVTGNRTCLPQPFPEIIDRVEQGTSGNTAGRMNLLLAYDPMEELRTALQNASPSDRFWEHLTVSTPVDLIIRSGGSPLLSNFLPLQSGYARLCFLEKLFNDLTPGEIREVLEQFSRLERKYGD